MYKSINFSKSKFPLLFIVNHHVLLCTVILLFFGLFFNINHTNSQLQKTWGFKHFQSLLLSQTYAAEALKPFDFDMFLNTYQKYDVLTLEIKSKNAYYTYAPHQEGVYPTELNLIENKNYTRQITISDTHSNTTSSTIPNTSMDTKPNTTNFNSNIPKNILILYPIGEKKTDPYNPNTQVYTYEGTQYFFLLFPKGFFAQWKKMQNANNTHESLALQFTFLACTKEHCLPQKDILPLDFEKLIPLSNSENISSNPLKNIETQSFYSTFQTLFDSTIKNGNNPPKKTLRLQDNNKIQETITEGTSQNKEKQKQQNEINTYTFTPQPLNTSLEVQSLYKALLFGLLAGFILNFMPCVLPVIGLKIRSFLQSQQDAEKESGLDSLKKEAEKKRFSAFREHNLFFAFGILTWFLVLGFLLGVLGFSWGQIFQNPQVVLILTLFIFAMSLSLFGVFHLPIFGTKIAHMLTEKPKQNLIEKMDTMTQTSTHKNTITKTTKTPSEKLSAFASGLLATLLATPCSGPLLGAVLGYSLTQPLPILLTIFLSMGFGMALPYFIFALRPSMVRFMPRAGNWLNNMEQILGFFLIATSIYLLSLLPDDWKMPALILAFCLSVSCALWGKIGSFHSKGLKKILVAFICILLVLMPSILLFQSKEAKTWINFTPQIFQERLGKEVLVLKFTADWCPTCKVLEHTVFTEKNMKALSSEIKQDLTFVYVDLTEFDETKQNLLKALDSVSIPLLAVFPKADKAYSPIIIRDMYTLDQVKEAIKLAE